MREILGRRSKLIRPPGQMLLQCSAKRLMEWETSKTNLDQPSQTNLVGVQGISRPLKNCLFKLKTSTSKTNIIFKTLPFINFPPMSSNLILSITEKFSDFQGTKTKLKKPLKATVFAQAITATGVNNIWTTSKAWQTLTDGSRCGKSYPMGFLTKGPGMVES